MGTLGSLLVIFLISLSKLVLLLGQFLRNNREKTLFTFPSIGIYALL